MEEAIAFCLSHGLVYGTDQAHLVTHLPVSLGPSPFPRGLFTAAQATAPLFGRLVQLVALDHEFLGAALAEAALADPFTGRLMAIYGRTREAVRGRVCLGVHRSDYMVHRDGEGGLHLRQIELNTISSAFGALGMFTSNMHRHLAELGLLAVDPATLPPSPSLPRIAEALFTACTEAVKDARAAGDRGQDGEADPVVLMVVQPGEKNFFDQRWLAYELWRAHRMRLVRLTLEQISKLVVLEDGKLPRVSLSAACCGGGSLSGEGLLGAAGGSANTAVHPIGLVYYRAGYKPEDYPTEVEWATRERLERTAAALCPSVGYQLAGTKKVQQVLADRAALERFLPRDQADTLLSTFAGLYSLDKADPRSDQHAAMAIADPHGFVLKPQREGGGNNLYEEDMAAALQRMSKEERAGYILMERIFPPHFHADMLRGGKALPGGDCVSELGIFCLYVGRGLDAPLINQEGGQILRTKSTKDRDGGVAAGVAVMDSVRLV